jgi:hypothetical protein
MTNPSQPFGARPHDPWAASSPQDLPPDPGILPRDASERVYQVGHHQVSISDKHRQRSPETYRMGGIGALVSLILVGSGIGNFPFIGSIIFLAMIAGGILVNRHFRLVARALEIERAGQTSGPTLRQLKRGLQDGTGVATPAGPAPQGPVPPPAPQAPRNSVPLQGVAESPDAFDLPRNHPLHGELVPAPGLRHGQNALKVLVHGKKIGYMAAEAADHYAPVLARYGVSGYRVLAWLGGPTGEQGLIELPTPAQLDREFQRNWRR